MKILKVSTKNPQDLKDDINDKIQNHEIRTWECDEVLIAISHKGEQYKDHFCFEYKVDDIKEILEFVLHTRGTSDFAESKALSLLEGMLVAHFAHRIEILK